MTYKIISITILIILLISSLMLFPIVGISALAKSNNQNLGQTNKNNTGNSGGVEICEDPEDPDTCFTPPDSGNDTGIPEHLIALCFKMTCKHKTPLDKETVNSVPKNSTILIGLSLNYTENLPKILQKNNEQLQSLLPIYFKNALNNLTNGNISTSTYCPKDLPPGILCRGIIVFNQ
jgi:hypothetical protein